RSTEDLASLRFFWRYLTDVRDTAFSLPALTRSVSALSGTGGKGRRFLVDGTWESSRSILDGIAGVVYIGKTTVVERGEEELSLDRNMAIFADVLRFAHRQKIDTRLFVTP